ncbi:MAG: hypothetical protein PHR43_06090 [Dehalococcoidales bacterium]|nr:hypothetical protein [Dehalococcoidales bacterium]
MKREAKLLLDKAYDSLILSVEFFNRPHDVGRVTTTLILIDHSFEMLLKAAILHRGGQIREKRANRTIGFDKCVRECLSDGNIKFLNEEQAMTIQSINTLRDAAQHHLLDISENQFYIQIQSGITLFKDLLKNVFDRELYEILPNRVLPISTTAPIDLDILFDSETKEITKLLQPGSRKRLEAQSKLRPLVILDFSIRGERVQPSATELKRVSRNLVSGKKWQDIFPGVASIEISESGTGPSLAIRWTKKEGVPIHTVPEGTPGAAVVAIKRVSELDFYSLGLKEVAEKVGLTRQKTLAMVRYLKIEGNLEYFKIIPIGKVNYKRYSQKAVNYISEQLPQVSMEEIWKKFGVKHGTKLDYKTI